MSIYLVFSDSLINQQYNNYDKQSWINKLNKFHLPNIIKNEIIINNLASPKRFKITVNIPELNDWIFW